MLFVSLLLPCVDLLSCMQHNDNGDLYRLNVSQNFSHPFLPACYSCFSNMVEMLTLHTSITIYCWFQVVTIDRERLISEKQNNKASPTGTRLPKEAMLLKDIFKYTKPSCTIIGVGLPFTDNVPIWEQHVKLLENFKNFC